jgi:hypothetical protein
VLQQAWSRIRTELGSLLGEHGVAIEIDDADYEAIIAAVAGGVDRRAVVRMIESWRLELIPFGIEIVVEPSVRMVAAAGGFAVLSTICFALGPAWSLSRPAVTADLKGEPGAVARRFGVGSLLVVGQLAVSLALVTAGGLFLRGALRAAGANPGFALEHQLVVTVDPGVAGYDETRARTLFRSMLQHVRATPGVVDASMASMVPFGELREGRAVRLTQDGGIGSDFVVIAYDYFKTLGLGCLRGREFTSPTMSRCDKARDHRRASSHAGCSATPTRSAARH